MMGIRGRERGTEGEGEVEYYMSWLRTVGHTDVLLGCFVSFSPFYNIIQMGSRGLDPINFIHRNLMFTYRQNQLRNLWDPVQNGNAGPPHLKILKLLRQQQQRLNQVGALQA